MKDVSIRSAVNVDARALAEYHRETRADTRLQDTWRWLYRVSPAAAGFPLVALDGDRVVAHAGGIPFTAQFEGRQYRAAWFVDFSVLPSLQRHGLGGQLTQAWMERSDLCVTFCNEKSMGVFRRYGWIESFETSFHTLWLRPFDHPKLARALPDSVRAAGNGAVATVARLFYRGFGSEDVMFEPVDADALGALMDSFADRSGCAVVPVRDRDYVTWRVAASPARDRYRLLRGAVTMLVKLSDRRPPSIDVLWMSAASSDAYGAVRRMLAALARWGLQHGYACVRCYPPNAELSRHLKGLAPKVSRPRFAYWTKDPSLLERLRRASWRWQLIDSDFEWA